jgi:DNA polymerase I-like protein with 3'-5' exonuclease and polymerase domains
VAVDFEYIPAPGSVRPLCGCAKELRSGHEYRVWQDELERLDAPPWPHGMDALFVSYNAPAELSAYLALDWPMPPHILDLLIEYRHLINGKVDKHKPRKLQDALRYFGLQEVEEKERWHQVILSGGPFDVDTQAGILDYCMEDVNAAARLLRAMGPKLPAELSLALLRGRYTVAVADMERRGVPIDEETWGKMLENRETIQRALAKAVNRIYPLYDDAGTFKLDAFGRWMDELGLGARWRRTRKSGRPAVDDDTFRRFAWHPLIERVRQARQVIQQLRKPPFEVAAGRNYFSIFPFQAQTSRNSTKGSIFQAPRWLRGLVQPKPDMDLVYIDFEQEEFLIGGALAGDDAVLRMYAAEDPYLSYGVRAGIFPPGATKDTHPIERDLAKTMVLAVQFGMTPHGLARRINVPLREAAELLKTHRQIFRKYWAWSDETVRQARWAGTIESIYHWQLAVSKEVEDNALRNFKVQSAGAEILRIANLLLWEAGIEVLSPVHDAFLIQSRRADLEDAAETARRAMEKAGKYVLGGHKLRTEMRILRYPERLLDKRGQVMWDLVQAIQNRLRVAA